MELKLMRDIALRSGDAVDTVTADFGVRGYKTGLVIIESTLNQAVSCQLQGKPIDGLKWQNIGAAVNVEADSAGSISVTAPWSVLRVHCTPAGAPASGALNIWLVRVIH